MSCQRAAQTNNRKKKFFHIWLICTSFVFVKVNGAFQFTSTTLSSPPHPRLQMNGASGGGGFVIPLSSSIGRQQSSGRRHKHKHKHNRPSMSFSSSSLGRGGDRYDHRSLTKSPTKAVVAAAAALTLSSRRGTTTTTTAMRSSSDDQDSLHPRPNDDDDNDVIEADSSTTTTNILTKLTQTIQSLPIPKSIYFTILISLCGALLGPFLDSYHSAFHVLQYEQPISFILWGTEAQPALTTAWWVPELFGLAGFIIGWLYILLDAILDTTPKQKMEPTWPLIFAGISVFTYQYYLSGALYSTGLYDRTTIFLVMSTISALGFKLFDSTKAGLITSLATCICGPLIEVFLLSTLDVGHGGGYRYIDLGETGFFPLWIVPVYFLGGPAVGNLARGIWNQLLPTSSVQEEEETSSTLPTKTKTKNISRQQQRPNCPICNDSRAVPCPNCDAQGYYVTYDREVMCKCCHGKGLVICRECFNEYDDDPNDLDRVREIMSKIPD